MRDGRVYIKKGLSKHFPIGPRLRILCILVKRECCVFEVMLALRISQPRAFPASRCSEGGRILKSRQKGSRVFYALNDTAEARPCLGVSEMADAMGVEGCGVADRPGAAGDDRGRRDRGVNRELQAFGEEVS